MPFTPFHFGPALFFGLLFFRKIHFPAFLMANIIVDMEPFLVLFSGLDYPLHGHLHSFSGGSIAAILLYLVMGRLDGNIRKFMAIFKLEQDLPLKSIWLTSFSGIYLHIILDSFLYTDIKPFYPFVFNPFYAYFSMFQVYLFCILLFISGIGLYVDKYTREGTSS